MKPGKYLLFNISDSGKGIEREALDRIFEPFFTTKPREKGTGLGLSVVHGIVKKLNGFIYVASEFGKGTEFRIFLPAADKNGIDADSSDYIITNGNENILLIDDEEIIIEAVKTNLINSGYGVTAFSKSKEALTEFKCNPDKYDIVITDYRMPELTGLDLAKKIRKIRKNIPVILYSGFINEDVSEKIMKTGIFRILNKPASTYHLTKAIRDALDVNRIF